MATGATANSVLNETPPYPGNSVPSTGIPDYELGLDSPVISIPLWIIRSISESLVEGCFESKGKENSAEFQYKKIVSGKSEKEAATDVSSWAKGEQSYEGESGKDFAKRLMDEKYGAGNYSTGPGSGYNKIKKWVG